MSTTRRAPEGGSAKQYLVKCEGCSFEQLAAGRGEATGIGSEHRQETMHEVVAVEVPPSMGSP